MLIATLPNWRLSIMSLVSRANDGIVVNDQQNRTAANNEYLASRLHGTARIENMSRILTGSVTRTIGDSARIVTSNRAGHDSSSEKCDSDRVHFARHVSMVGITSSFWKKGGSGLHQG